MKKHNKEPISIDVDVVQEIQEVLKYAIKGRSWIDVEDCLELINEALGHPGDEEEDERKNRMEE